MWRRRIRLGIGGCLGHGCRSDDRLKRRADRALYDIVAGRHPGRVVGRFKPEKNGLRSLAGVAAARRRPPLSVPCQTLPSPPIAQALLRPARGREGRSTSIVIGGGATGLGVAVDAAARGFSTVLLEADDFAKGTSSRATKLVHGGVRYLAQGNVPLVREALRERSLLLAQRAAPRPDLCPSSCPPTARRRLWDVPVYGIGLAIYDALAGRQRLGPRRPARPPQTARAPRRASSRTRLVGGDPLLGRPVRRRPPRRGAGPDRRSAHGACVLNHCRVRRACVHERHGDRGRGRRCDRETGAPRRRCARPLRGQRDGRLGRRRAASLDEPAAADLVAPSGGPPRRRSRVVPVGDGALLVPKTADGRVLFAVPWLGKVILGTTDTPRHDTPLEPRPFAAEVDFILDEAGRRLAAPLSRIRPLGLGRPAAAGEAGRGRRDTKRSRASTSSRFRRTASSR